MRKPRIAIKLSPEMYVELIALGNGTLVALTGNANFISPAVSLLNLQAAINDVSSALSLWRPAPNVRGTTADLADLQQKSLTLYNLLWAEAQYVATTALIAAGNDYAAMRGIMATSSFPLSDDPVPQGILQMVQGFQRFVSRQLAPNQVKLKWKKPLNVTTQNNVKSYKVMRGTTNVLSDAVELAVVTKTSFVDQNSTGVLVMWTYWIIPVNSFGDGVPSDGITLSIPAV